MNQPRTYPEGATCWVDIEAADVEEAARFYGALFDWTFIETKPKPRYLVARLNGQDAAGIGEVSEPGNSPRRVSLGTRCRLVSPMHSVGSLRHRRRNNRTGT